MTKLKALTALLAVQMVLTIAAIGLALFALLGDHRALTGLQSSRVVSCQDTNTRHSTATTYLVALLDAAEGRDTPAARARAAASEKSIQPLIDALAPVRQCSTINSSSPNLGPAGSTGPTGPLGLTTP